MKTEILKKHGRLFYAIDGKTIPGIFSSTQAKFMQNFIDAGFEVFDTHPFVPHGWVGPDEYDYTETDRFIEAYLKQKPDALLILRFWMGYQNTHDSKEDFWWGKANPEQLTYSNQGHTGLVVPTSPSFASKKFRTEAAEAIRRAVAHIESKYGEHVLMYEPGGGTWGEWFHWLAYYFGDMNDPTNLEDYSAPMRAHFAAYLEQQYTNIAQLNDLYRTSYNSFAEVPLPQIDSRYKAQNGILRSVPDERPVLDFYMMFNEVLADTLVSWARAIKEGCQGNKLVGVYYGYLWNHHSMGQPLARSGHTSIEKALNCADIDVMGAPFGYSFRQLGGVTASQSIVGGAMARGKQFLQEYDNSTHVASGWACPEHSNPETAEETGQLFRRELNRVLSEGSSCIYMDLFGGMYNERGVIEQLGQALKKGNSLYDEMGRNNCQVAVVMDPRDSHYFEEENPVYMAYTMMFKQFELERMGLGSDDFILEDLDRLSPEETAKYKLWIFPSLVHLTPAHRERIQRHCLRNGNIVLWNYGVGVCSEQGLSLEPMKELTGFECDYTMEAGEVVVRTEIASQHTLLAGVDKAISYGTYGDLSPDFILHHASKDRYFSKEQGFSVAPRFFIKNADIELGKLLEMPKPDCVGLGVKNMGHWTSVLSTAPLVPAKLLRNLAREAGCHVYTDFLGQTLQCDGFFTFYAHADGLAKFSLPHAADVTEEYCSAKVGADITEFEFPVKTDTAYIFRLS